MSTLNGAWEEDVLVDDLVESPQEERGTAAASSTNPKARKRIRATP
jgi:hypothetical protein